MDAEAAATDGVATIVVDCFVQSGDDGQDQEEAITAPAPMLYDLNEALSLDKCRDYSADAGCIHSSATLGQWLDPARFEMRTASSKQKRAISSTKNWHVIDWEDFYHLNSPNGRSLMFVHTNIAQEQLENLQLHDWTLTVHKSDQAAEVVSLHLSGAEIAASAVESEDEPEEEIMDDTEDSSEGSDEFDDVWEPPRRTRTRDRHLARSSRLRSRDQDESAEQPRSASASGVAAPDNTTGTSPGTADAKSSSAGKKRKCSTPASDNDKSAVPKMEDVESKPAIKRPSPETAKSGDRDVPIDVDDSPPSRCSTRALRGQQVNSTRQTSAMSALPSNYAASINAATTTTSTQTNVARERQQRLAQKKLDIMSMELAKAKADLEFEKEFGETPA